jgi:hypothetical protein
MVLFSTVEEYLEMAFAAPRDDLLFPVDTVGALLAALGEVLAGATGPLRRAVAPFEAALAEINTAAAVAPPLQNLPVCAHLEAACEAARASRAERLVKAVAPLAVDAFWTQNPNYQRRPPAAGFLDGYGYFVVAGPADGAPAFVESPSLAVGLLLLGPGTSYPTHRHPAEELYIPLTDQGEWQKGEAAWRAELAGGVIHHPPDLPHATRAGAGPLLALYLWRGALATHARLSPA